MDWRETEGESEEMTEPNKKQNEHKHENNTDHDNVYRMCVLVKFWLNDILAHS